MRLVEAYSVSGAGRMHVATLYWAASVRERVSMHHIVGAEDIVDSVEISKRHELISPHFSCLVRYLLALSRGGLCPLLRAAPPPIAQMRALAVARGVRLQ